MSEPTNANKTSLTTRETELAVLALQSLKNGKVELDEEKFANIAGYANSRSANVCFANLKKKLNTATVEEHFVAAGTGGTVKATPKKPRGKAAAKSEDPDTPTKTPSKRKGDDEPSTPSSKRAKKAASVKKEEKEEEDEDANGVPDAGNGDED